MTRWELTFEKEYLFPSEIINPTSFQKRLKKLVRRLAVTFNVQNKQNRYHLYTIRNRFYPISSLNRSELGKLIVRSTFVLIILV